MPTNPTIKISFEKAKTRGLPPSEFVMVKNLGQYGFDADIIDKMIKYDIFPQTYLIVGNVYVVKASIAGILNRMVKNTMTMYDEVAANEAKVAELQAQVDAETPVEPVPLTASDIEAIHAGETTLQDVVLSKQPTE